jgi:hypothetical protein
MNGGCTTPLQRRLDGRFARFLCLPVMLSSIWGQTHTATMRGMVADETHAAVTNAFIRLTNIEQQWTRKDKADASGEFVFVQVPPGHYNLSVEAPGFKVHHRRGLTLEVAEVTVIDVRLEVGSATESITVNGDSPLIEPGSTSIAEVIIGTTIRSHPVNVRNTSNLVALTPGINTTRGFRGPGSSSGASDRIAFQPRVGDGTQMR